ncbi:acetolactate decarboxylase [Herbiconiux sp. VKM Ac-1786]
MLTERINAATGGQIPSILNTFAPTTGTAAGFRTPAFEAGLSVPGYHLH